MVFKSIRVVIANAQPLSFFTDVHGFLNSNAHGKRSLLFVSRLLIARWRDTAALDLVTRLPKYVLKSSLPPRHDVRLAASHALENIYRTSP